MWPFKTDYAEQQTIQEGNAERQMRPIIWKLRKVKNRLASVGRKIGMPEQDIAHWALQVGDYCHELHTDRFNQKSLTHQRLTGSQIWETDLPDSIPGKYFVGTTEFTDREVNTMAKEVDDEMRSMPGGRYHVLSNNCQHFVYRLLCKIRSESPPPPSYSNVDAPYPGENEDILHDDQRLQTWQSEQTQNVLEVFTFLKEAKDDVVEVSEFANDVLLG